MTSTIKQTIEDILPEADLHQKGGRSIDRYTKIINDSEFRKRYNIKWFSIRAITDTPIELHSVYVKDGQLIQYGEEDRKISEQPIIVAYSDGAIEYLERVVRTGANSPPVFECILRVPSINSELHYQHPIKNADLAKLVQEYT